MVLFIGMTGEDRDRELSSFTVAVYHFLRKHIDTLDVDKITGADFSTLIDLKRDIDKVVAQGIERWRSGEMP